jgi:UDP-glucose 4-epimerase
MDTRRDFVFINDLIDVVLMALEGVGEKGFYHISSGTDFSIKELFDATIQALKIIPVPQVEVRPRGPDDAYTILLDPSKTNRVYRWKVKTSLSDGVKKAIEWYKEKDITQTYTHLKAER